jgi:hypothetical protein
MRKFIALGVGAVASATMAFGAFAGPASAVVSPPGSLTGQVCSGLPAQITSAATALTNATAAKAAAVAALPGKAADLATAQTTLVAALIDYIQTVDNGGAVDVKTLVLNDATTNYVAKATAWGNASSAIEVASRNFDIASMAPVVLSSLSAGLVCV